MHESKGERSGLGFKATGMGFSAMALAFVFVNTDRGHAAPRGTYLRPPMVLVCHFNTASGQYEPQMRPFVRIPPSDCLVNDGVPCTLDSCNPELGCVHTPHHAACDDGLFCNGVESCTPLGCAAVSACPPAIMGCVEIGSICDEDNDTCLDFADDTRCDDENECTDDHCDLATGDCSHTDSECDDGVFCNGAETCVPPFGCVAVSACPPSIDGCVIRNGICDEDRDECIDLVQGRRCNDHNDCTLDVCDPVTGDCTNTTIKGCEP